MPYSGSGGTSQPVGGAFPAVGSTLIEAAKVNISIADIYSMLATALLKDGQQVATQRIPFAAGISTDTVLEKTSDTGVTLDSVLLKDGRIDTTQGADIVCAATINLETATGNVVDVTGSTGPVTAITLSQGHWRIVRFTGTPTLTHGASLVLPGAANIVAVAGDFALFIGYAAGVVRVSYMRADGTSISTAPFSDSTAIVKGSSDATKLVRIEADGLTTGTTRVATMPDYNLTLGQVVVKIVTFTRDTSVASGTQAVTGVGFQPRAVVFVAGTTSGTGKASIGIDDATTPQVVFNNHNASADTWAFDVFSIELMESGTAFNQGKITALGADGFTITWTKTGSPSGTVSIGALCFR